MQRLLPLLFLATACATPAPRPAPAAEGRSGPPATRDAGALAAAIHARSNEARRARGAPTVTWNDALAEAAARHSRDMARRGYFAHTSPEGTRVGDRAEAARAACTRVLDDRIEVAFGENLFRTPRFERILVTTGPVGTRRDVVWKRPDALVDEVVRGWLDSPSHRANLLHARHRLGAIGVAVSEADDVFVTQIFC